MLSSYVVNLSVYMNSFQLKLRIDEQLYSVMRAKRDDKLVTTTIDKLLSMANGTCQQTKW